MWLALRNAIGALLFSGTLFGCGDYGEDCEVLRDCGQESISLCKRGDDEIRYKSSNGQSWPCGPSEMGQYGVEYPPACSTAAQNAVDWCFAQAPAAE